MEETVVSSFKYHLFELPVGWVGLIGSDRGLRRVSLKPSPQEAMEGLGDDLKGATNDPASLEREQLCLVQANF